MPEFIQKKIVPHHVEIVFINGQKIIIRFDQEAHLQDYQSKISLIGLKDVDLHTFAEAIGQNLTQKTKSIWHPFKSHWGGIKKEYINES